MPNAWVAADALAATVASPAAPSMDVVIPYAGYLAAMALLWIVLRLSAMPS